MADKISFDRWLVNLSEEIEVPLELLNSTLKQLAGTEEDATRREQLQIARDLSQRFTILMHNLNLAALEQTHLALLKISKVDLARFLTELADRFRSSVSRSSEIHLHLNTIPEPTFTDLERVKKIIYTLISNAVQFSKDGGARVDVTLEATAEEARIIVQDDGIGIVPEKLDHVFDPLYDDDPVHLKLYQSTSAGLYLIMLYAKALGGNIKVESEKMVFTRFTLYLPMITREEQINYRNYEITDHEQSSELLKEARYNLSRDFRAQRQNTFGSTTVLALGNQELLKGFEDYFKQELRLMLNSDSALAMARALHLKPDLIILHDDNYGDISADQVAKTLKSHELTDKIPLVWISHNGKHPQADLNLSIELSKTEMFEKISDLLHLRQKLMDELLRDRERTSNKPRYQNSKEAFLTRLERIVDAHLMREDLDMNKLSEMLFLNRSQIHRKIKSYTGMNTTEYIRNYKLKLAYRDLKHQNGTVSEIAYRNGFNSPSYFTKSFREVYGISPSAVADSNSSEVTKN